VFFTIAKLISVDKFYGAFIVSEMNSAFIESSWHKIENCQSVRT